MTKSRISRLEKITAGLTLLYAVIVIGWAIAHRFVGDGFWLLALTNGFAIYLFAPLPLAVILAALTKSRLTQAALFGLALLFLSLFGGDLMPPSPVARAGAKAPTLTVMTYNVLYINSDAAPIAASVTAANPDLIAFQELTPLLAQQLEREIGAHYPYRTPLHPADCYAEAAIWSRYPLQVEAVDEEILCRVRPVVVDLGATHFESASHLYARVVNVHAWSYSALDRESVERGFRWREEQIEWVLDHTAGQPEPLVLLGDLNSTPMHEVYHTLSTHLIDGFREAGWGLGHTFPATGGCAWGVPHPGRLVRIDHIFHSDDWQAEAAWVGEWDGQSDHRPVVARLRLPCAD